MSAALFPHAGKLHEPWIWPEITVEFVEKCCFHPLLAVRRSNLAWIIHLDGLPLGAKVRERGTNRHNNV